MMRTIPSVDHVREYLRPLDFFERYVHGREEGEVYVDTHARRFHETLAWLPDLPPGARVLELGAVPYYMTVLLRTHGGLSVDPLSFYEVDAASAIEHEVSNAETGERFRFPYRAVNVERDAFPVQAGSYDLVVCCEILEHLLINPSHMLYEAHRALRPGGWLLITTPNVARWANVLALIEGRNINDRYHGNGIYGRHNREYTLAEVGALVDACGYDVARAATCDVYPPVLAASSGATGANREDTIFVLARASREARIGCPGSLYVLMDEYRAVSRSRIAMDIDEIGHLGRGWYDPERDGARGCRWTAAAAEFFLGSPDGAREIAMEACAHHPDLAERPLALSVQVDGRALGDVLLRDYGWQWVRWALPAATAAGPPVAGRLAVSRTWSPADAGGEDRRALGVRVCRIEVR